MDAQLVLEQKEQPKFRMAGFRLGEALCFDTGYRASIESYSDRATFTVGKTALLNKAP